MAAACRMCLHWAKLGRFPALSGVRWLSTSRVTRCEAGEGDAHSTQDNSGETEDDIRERVLNASLSFVPEFGWTKKALAAGAEAEGLPGVAHGLFPRGGAELALHLYSSNNTALRELMQAETEEPTEEKKRVRDFVQDAVEARLRMTIPYIDQWPQAMAILSLPPNAPDAFKNLTTLVDDIWYYAGDRSTDFNWYTKRVSLAAVYKASELCLLQDRSPEFTDTWAFLDRRLEGVAQLGKITRKLQQSGDVMCEGLYGAYHVARNMTGMNARVR